MEDIRLVFTPHKSSQRDFKVFFRTLIKNILEFVDRQRLNPILHMKHCCGPQVLFVVCYTLSSSYWY